jgi:membrane protein YdbS with pleckstrin-like domain
LDRAVVAAWRLRGLILLAFVAVPAVGLAVPVVLAEPALWPPVAVAFAVAAAVLVTLVLAWPAWSFRRWSYRLDETLVETRHGVVVRISQVVPLTRLQHVDLRSGPIERAFGLSTLVLYTAGTHDAAVGIPGLSAAEAARLRDHLVALGARGDDGV